jgi:hypothetical protein
VRARLESRQQALSIHIRGDRVKQQLVRSYKEVEALSRGFDPRAKARREVVRLRAGSQISEEEQHKKLGVLALQFHARPEKSTSVREAGIPPEQRYSAGPSILGRVRASRVGGA